MGARYEGLTVDGRGEERSARSRSLAARRDGETLTNDLDTQTHDLKGLVAMGVALEGAGDDAERAQREREGVAVVCPALK